MSSLPAAGPWILRRWKLSKLGRCRRQYVVRALCWFLGLTGYYWKFIKDYGTVARPLTQLLKREAFLWYVEADAAFTVLKLALTPGHELAPLVAMERVLLKYVLPDGAPDHTIPVVYGRDPPSLIPHRVGSARGQGRLPGRNS
jgi:hypothetical protein